MSIGTWPESNTGSIHKEQNFQMLLNGTNIPIIDLFREEILHSIKIWDINGLLFNEARVTAPTKIIYKFQ